MEQLFLDFQAALQEHTEGRMRYITTSLLRRRITLAFLFAIWKDLERKDWQIYRNTKPGQTLLVYCQEAFLQLDERDHLRKLMDDMGRVEQADVLAFIDWITAPGADDPRQTLTLTGGSTSISGTLAQRTLDPGLDAKTLQSDNPAFSIDDTVGPPSILSLSNVLPF
jgi:hypothetical protein